MADPERRLTTQGVERKEQLLDAAARLFADRGYAQTRIVDICREAGVAKGLFYWYFETKEQVFRDLADGLRLRLRRAQAAAMDADADPLVQLRQGSEASVRFMAAHAQSFALVAVENVDREFVEDIRRGTEVHADDTERIVPSACPAFTMRTMSLMCCCVPWRSWTSGSAAGSMARAWRRRSRVRRSAARSRKTASLVSKYQ